MDSISLPKVISNLKATYRKGEFWRCEYPVTNQYAAAFHTLTNVGVLANGTNADIVTTNTGSIFVPKNPESFTYDLDGNLTSDGHWTNSWDGENRLIQMETISSVPIQAKQKLVFSYDHQSRRIRKVVYNWNTNTSQYYVGLDLKFLYDAWNLIAELNGTNNNLICSYMWGSDLSGSMRGAGGVGGLVCINHSQLGAQFPAYDGNGNVMGLVDAVQGTNSAAREFGVFGQELRGGERIANASPFRFSSKYQDTETSLSYYGYRYLDSAQGRWYNRDRIAEQGGGNLYGFSQNGAVNRIDPDGRRWFETRSCNQKEWTRCNQGCKKDFGWWSVVDWCWAVKGLELRGSCLRADLWIVVYACTSTAPDPGDPGDPGTGTGLIE